MTNKMLTFTDLEYMSCLDYLDLDLDQKTTDKDAAIVLGFAQSLELGINGLDAIVEEYDGEYYIVVDTSSMIYADAVTRFPGDNPNQYALCDLCEWPDIEPLFTAEEWDAVCKWYDVYDDDYDPTSKEDGSYAEDFVEAVDDKVDMAIKAMLIRDFVANYVSGDE